MSDLVVFESQIWMLKLNTFEIKFRLTLLAL